MSVSQRETKVIAVTKRANVKNVANFMAVIVNSDAVIGQHSTICVQKQRGDHP